MMQQRNLSPLEESVMEVVWQLKTCSVRQVMKEIGSKRKLAYTSVATILFRLEQKGWVKKKMSGPVCIYSPRHSKIAYGRNLAKSFLSGFFRSMGEAASVSFAESLSSLPKKKRQELLKLLEQYHGD